MVLSVHQVTRRRDETGVTARVSARLRQSDPIPKRSRGVDGVGCNCLNGKGRALNSAVECHPHTVEVTGSNPVAPTIIDCIRFIELVTFFSSPRSSLPSNLGAIGSKTVQDVSDFAGDLPLCSRHRHLLCLVRFRVRCAAGQHRRARRSNDTCFRPAQRGAITRGSKTGGRKRRRLCLRYRAGRLAQSRLCRAT